MWWRWVQNFTRARDFCRPEKEVGAAQAEVACIPGDKWLAAVWRCAAQVMIVACGAGYKFSGRVIGLIERLQIEALLCGASSSVHKKYGSKKRAPCGWGEISPTAATCVVCDTRETPRATTPT